jgi:hypothetical protein
MSVIFRTPIRSPGGPRFTVDATWAQKQLLGHFNVHPGYPVAVLITGGVITEKAVPTVDDMAAADVVFMGGRENEVDPTLENLLLAAGYVLDYTTPFGYGSGVYGNGRYG